MAEGGIPMSAFMIAICLLSPSGAIDLNSAYWHYPGSDRGSSGVTQHGDQRLGAYYCKEIEADFGAVLEWYADRAKAPGLTQAYRDYVNRSPDAADESFGSLSAVNGNGDTATLGTFLYAFSPQHQHVTMMLAPDSQHGRVVISIAGSQAKTTVQVAQASD
jgi:hypothetical protein